MTIEREPPRDCPLCPRLRTFILEQREAHPDWHNAPVPTLEPASRDHVRLLVVGLAPGLRGANRTGRAFTGDWAGRLLYDTLIAHGFAEGPFEERPDDRLSLIDVAVTNAVRCVPPQNKPVGAEIRTCRTFLEATIGAYGALTHVLCLGRISHDSTVRALGGRLVDHPFGHGAVHALGELELRDSYHCSRYNTNTGVLTASMFSDVVESIRAAIDADPRPRSGTVGEP